MYTSWRSFAVITLAFVWPQFGCELLRFGKSTQEVRPVPEKPVTPPMQSISAAEQAQSLLRQADALEKIGQINEAIALYEQIRQAGADYGCQATKRLALLYDRTNQWQRAEQEYRIVQQQSPKDAETLCNLGYINYRRGHFYAAEKDFQNAVYYKPDLRDAWINLALTQAQLEEYDKSINSFCKYFSKAEAYCNVAAVLTLKGKQEDAIRALQTARHLEPTNPRVRWFQM